MVAEGLHGVVRPTHLDVGPHSGTDQSPVMRARGANRPRELNGEYGTPPVADGAERVGGLVEQTLKIAAVQRPVPPVQQLLKELTVDPGQRRPRARAGTVWKERVGRGKFSLVALHSSLWSVVAGHSGVPRGDSGGGSRREGWSRRRVGRRGRGVSRRGVASASRRATAARGLAARGGLGVAARAGWARAFGRRTCSLLAPCPRGASTPSSDTAALSALYSCVNR